MLRFLALTAVLFAIPFVAYAAWIAATQRRLPNAADWPMGRLIVQCVIGAVFVLIGLVILVVSSGPDTSAETAAILGPLLVLSA